MAQPPQTTCIPAIELQLRSSVYCNEKSIASGTAMLFSLDSSSVIHSLRTVHCSTLVLMGSQYTSYLGETLLFFI